MKFQKTNIGSYLGSKIEEEKKNFGPSSKFFFIPRSPRTTRKNHLPPAIMALSNFFFFKSKYFDITNKEIMQIPKSESKKFSILSTFKKREESWAWNCVVVVEMCENRNDHYEFISVGSPL